MYYTGLTYTIHKRLTEYTNFEDSQITEIIRQLRIALGDSLDAHEANIYTLDDLQAEKEKAAELKYIDGFNDALDFAHDLSAGTPAEQNVQDIYNELYKK